MPLFCFPNPDALRLSLASGIVPADVAVEPARAETDGAGRIWVEFPSGFPKEAIAALTRIGVTIHGPGIGPKLQAVTRWAELLPLKPNPGAAMSGRVLIEVPDGHLTQTVTAIQRLRSQPIEVRLVGTGNLSWIVLSDPSPSLMLLLNDQTRETKVFVEHGTRVWIESGWVHPLEQHIAAPDQHSVMLRAGHPWQVVRNEPVHQESQQFVLRAVQNPKRVERPASLSMPISLRLRRCPEPHPEVILWTIPGDGSAELASLANETDERVLRRYRVAVVNSDPQQWTVLQAINSNAKNPPLLPDIRGYVPHSVLSNVFLPAGYQLTPSIRPHILARTIGLKAGHIVWLQLNDGGTFTRHRVPLKSFQNLADIVRYQVAPTAKLRGLGQRTPIFSLPRFVVETEPQSPVFITRSESRRNAPDAPSQGSRDGWLSRSIGRVAGKLLSGKAIAQTGKKYRKPDQPLPTPLAAAPVRVLDKLSSPQVLLMGNEWTTRRLELEQRILTDLPRLPPAARALLWTELAEVYTAVGYPADAAVCWLNAIWDDDPPPLKWLSYWLAAESRASRLTRGPLELPVLLNEVRSAQAARVAMAYLCWGAAQPSPPTELFVHLGDLVGLLDDHEEELPARGVWLARLAVSKLTDGDALGLARCQDRVFQRLVEKGPGLDLDAPSFLRFRGVAAGERFSTAREWLIRIRDPIHRWLSRLTTSGRLQWAGIDGELTNTTAYADLMVAWGLSVVGDRTRSKELENHASRVLLESTGAGLDPAVPRILLATFTDRIRAAQDGRAAAPILRSELRVELGQLDDLARYAVDKLRATIGILEPNELVNAYQRRDLAGFLSTDALGQRLTQFLTTRAPLPQVSNGWSLLAVDAADPPATTMPRIIFTLLEMAPYLDPQLVAAVIPQTIRAIELIPEWVRLGIPHADATTMTNRFGRRMLVAACHAASLFHLPDSFRAATEALIERCETPDSVTAILFEPIAGTYFRCLRRLGLTQLAAVLLSRLRGGSEAGPRELGLTVGLFAIGDEDAGSRVLNAARDRLFVKSIGDDRDRTSVAIAYATALAHAPPRIALGRLEELFLRLDMVSTAGATNRYYTLKPLQLIDTVIRAVVSDDFSLGPGVRGWLDDDEFLIRLRVTRELQAALNRMEG